MFDAMTTAAVSLRNVHLTLPSRAGNVDILRGVDLEVKPGEALKIGHRSAESSRIVVYAVDEGIHQITRYKLPEPLPHFFRKRALEVGTQRSVRELLAAL